MVLWFFSSVVELFPVSVLGLLCSSVVLQFQSCMELTGAMVLWFFSTMVSLFSVSLLK